MPDPLRSKGKLVVAVTLAIMVGLGAAILWENARRSPTVTFVEAPPVPDGPALALSRPVPAELSDGFSGVAQAITPGVVRIQTERFDDAGRADSGSGRGSGFVVSANGYIVTNNHVIADADRIRVSLVDKRVFDAELVGRDPTTDLAVIRVPTDNLPVLTLGDSDRAQVGEWVLAVGNPGFGRAASTLDFTVTVGIISASGRPLPIINRELYAGDDPAAGYAIEDFIQTDAAINPGNSGGPLVNLQGEVIGVNTAIASGTGYFQGYGFAIPINLAKRVVRDLIEHGNVRRPLLGVSIADLTAEDAEVYHLPEISGVLVEDFSDDSPAERAGLRRHDVIVALDGGKVERSGQLQRMVAQYEPGEVAEVTVIRYGEELRFPVRLTQSPLRPLESRGTPRRPATREPGLGLHVEELTSSTAREYGFSVSGGALVSRVLPFSPADRKGVTAGTRIMEINGERIETAGDARRILRRARPGQVVSLLLESRDGSTSIANIRVP